MEWFKHQTCSHDDPDISDAWDEYGDAAYVVFFVILEIYGQEYNHTEDGWLDISKRFLTRKLRKSWTKAEQVLSIYQGKGRIEFKENGTRVKIKCHKFIDIASNWTKRHADKPTEVPTEVPTAKEEEEKKKKKNIEEKTIVVFTELNFGNFYENYPKKAEKADAFKEWLKLNSTKLTYDDIMIPLGKQKIAGMFSTDPKFIMSPRRWLHGKRWEDAIIQKSNTDSGRKKLDIERDDYVPEADTIL